MNRFFFLASRFDSSFGTGLRTPGVEYVHCMVLHTCHFPKNTKKKDEANLGSRRIRFCGDSEGDIAKRKVFRGCSAVTVRIGYVTCLAFEFKAVVESLLYSRCRGCVASGDTLHFTYILYDTQTNPSNHGPGKREFLLESHLPAEPRVCTMTEAILVSHDLQVRPH
jgi:hypothetical protein